jgi:hypothetical protein
MATRFTRHHLATGCPSDAGPATAFAATVLATFAALVRLFETQRSAD